MHDWYMDERHVAAIQRAACAKKRFRALEVGAFHGFSTCALLHAAMEGLIEELHVCDPVITAQLKRRIQASGVAVTLHECKSVELLSRDCDWDFVVVDGDHSLTTCVEEARLLLAAGVPEVFAHDTAHMEGPAALKAAFIADGRYACAEDAALRVGERTHRGLFHATLKPPAGGASEARRPAR